MIFKREIFADLQKHLGKRQMTVITGMRRTGKTTLIRQLLDSAKSDNKLYFDMERMDNRQLFSENNYDNIPVAFSQKGLDTHRKAYIAIDEIQLLPSIPSVLKYLYDHYDMKFIVTGSRFFKKYRSRNSEATKTLLFG